MLLTFQRDCLIICRLMEPDKRSHKQLVVKKPKNQAYITCKIPRVVKTAEFYSLFSTFTADFDSSRLQCLIPLP